MFKKFRLWKLLEECKFFKQLEALWTYTNDEKIASWVFHNRAQSLDAIHDAKAWPPLCQFEKNP